MTMTMIDSGVSAVDGSVMEVTPDLAQRWLLKNQHNRRMKLGTVTVYARDMAEGRWLFTGEAIKFAKDGTLLDGQNRLAAVVKAGVTVKMLVLFGLEREAQDAMDTGVQRSGADVLMLGGVPNHVSVAAIAKVHRGWAAGELTHSMATLSADRRPGNSELRQYVEAHPSLVEIAPMAKRITRSLRMTIGGVGTAVDVLSGIDPVAASDFFDRLEGNRTAGLGDPLNACLHRTGELRLSRATMTPGTVLFLLFRTWNAYRRGERLTRLNLSTSAHGARMGVKAGAGAMWTAIPTPL